MLKFKAESYDGKKIGNSGFNHRRGVQIVATENGKRKSVFTIRGQYRTYKTPCLKLWEGAAHYKSGLNQKDAAKFSEAIKYAEELAARMNKTQDPTQR